jgi:hypothetical protein
LDFTTSSGDSTTAWSTGGATGGRKSDSGGASTGVATGDSLGDSIGATGTAAALGARLAAGFLVEIFAIDKVLVSVTEFLLPMTMPEKSSRIGRAASGKVQFEFTDRLSF